MKIDLSAGEIQLANNLPICARQARGLRVTCTCGIIWITVDGELGDTYLTAGQTHELRSNGLAIIESIGSGSIRLARQQAFPTPHRIMQALKIRHRPPNYYIIM